MKPPHIILLMTDQQRYDTIAELGARHMVTPHLDRLAREGVRLTHCFCAAPSCVPSRASFFNGCYPHTLGVLRNSHPWGDSWVEAIARQGYHCVSIGKMHTVPFDAPCGFHQRFVVENKDRPLRLHQHERAYYDEWDKFLANNGRRKPSRESYRAEHPEYETALGAYAWPLEERYHPDVFVGDMTLWWLEQRRAQSPLFLVVGFPGPHPPYDPIGRCLDLYRDADMPLPTVSAEELERQPPVHRQLRREMIQGNHDAVRWRERPTNDQLRRLRRHYAANVSLIDVKIGQILARLESNGYLENAVVIFTSDHGDCLGDHGLIQKWTMYDAITRVPALVWSPGRVREGAIVDDLVQQMDLADTILSLAGATHPTPWEAQPVPGLVSEETQPPRETVFAEHIRDNILQEADYVSMIRGRQWKLVHYLDREYGELYDLETDPGETQNLWEAPEHRATRRQLLDALLNWRIRSAARPLL